MHKPIRIIGAGLAGSEAAWQCARRGIAVELFEMRPVRLTPAHQTAKFAELVCSNSLKSDTENTAPWLLKEEMRRAGSLLIQIARETAVPAGHALAVDREKFSEAVTAAIEREPLIRIVREEVTADRRERRHHDCRQRSANLRRAARRDPAAERQPATVLLRLDQPDRGSRFHRHVARVHGGALRQGHRGLHQLSDDQGRVRPLPRCAAGGAIGGLRRIGRA